MAPHRTYTNNENIDNSYILIQAEESTDTGDWPSSAVPVIQNSGKNLLLSSPDMSHDAHRSCSFSSVKEDTDGTSQSFLVRVSSSRDLVSPQSVLEDWAKCLPAYGVPLLDSEVIEEESSEASSLSTPTDVQTPQLDGYFEKYEVNGVVNLQELPVEVLENVIDFLAVDLPPQDYGPRNVDLVSCLLTSKSLYKATMNILYKNITIPHSYVFSKFLTHLKKFPELGRLVRRMDLSHFTSIGLGRTIEMNKEIQNMTSKTLLECLELMPHIQELLLQEHLDHDIDEDVLFKIFAGLPKLRALDLCGAYANGFEKGFTEAMTRAIQQSERFRIRRLSLHECFTIKNSDIEALISRLPKLEILDLYHTRVTSATLQSIPETARLTHLNLGHCNHLSGEEVVRFLLTHPAASELVYLNLSCDPARHRMLRSIDLDILLPALPQTLRSLNLGGSSIDSSKHLSHLLTLSTHLEELGLAHTNLSMADIKSFFPPPAPSPNSSPLSIPADTPTPNPTLHYLDLTDIPSVTQPALFFHRGASSRIDADHPPPIPHFLSTATLPLEVLELSKRITTDLQRFSTSNARFAWTPKELGRRNWYVRVQGSQDRSADPAGGREDGGRWWKMGSRSWGMRKIPVCVGEVGGLYGFHMFKK